MKRRYGVVSIVVILAALLAVGATFAWIVATTHPVVNTFTAGNIRISLDESTGDCYRLVPGIRLAKDPTVTVKADSESCWLFFRMEKVGDPDTYLTYAVAEGWTALPGVDEVYYRQVAAAEADIAFPLLQNDAVTVKETVTEEMLDSLSATPKMTFYAYAIQAQGLESVELAWQNLQAAEVSVR